MLVDYLGPYVRLMCAAIIKSSDKQLSFITIVISYYISK